MSRLVSISRRPAPRGRGPAGARAFAGDVGALEEDLRRSLGGEVRFREGDRALYARWSPTCAAGWTRACASSR